MTFRDFSFYKLVSVLSIRYIGGFAKAGCISIDDYLSAPLDPLCSFAKPIMQHMNADHADSLVQIVSHYTEMQCLEARMVSIDHLGMTVSVFAVSEDANVSSARCSYWPNWNSIRLISLKFAFHFQEVSRLVKKPKMSW